MIVVFVRRSAIVVRDCGGRCGRCHHRPYEERESDSLALHCFHPLPSSVGGADPASTRVADPVAPFMSSDTRMVATLPAKSTGHSARLEPPALTDT